MPRLSKQVEQEILDAYEALEGESVAPITERFKISRQTLYNILYRNGREPHRRRPTQVRAGRLPDDVVAFIQMVSWNLEGLVEAKVVEITLDKIKERYGLD